VANQSNRSFRGVIFYPLNLGYISPQIQENLYDHIDTRHWLTFPAAARAQSQAKNSGHAHTRRQWKALLNEFNDSGLTRSAFCEKHRIATSSLYRWQQIFAEESGAATDFIDVTPPLSSTPAPPPAHALDNDWQVELELGAGIVLRLRTT
jgi:hypothetical protein